uniref:hypothetical protein n=1 Tax=Microbacterium proteolyticum TaxID=1572644 RepID=UPI002415A591|nr:hypothetical protein [Microbacterium proteolyticum]
MAIEIEFRGRPQNLQRAAQAVEDAFDDIGDRVDDLGRDGRRSLDKLDEGLSKAKQGAADFKEESSSTAREAAASFDGTAEAITDAFQETAANAFAGFGPAGAVAGVAAAAGIGLVTAAFQQADERRQQLQDRANDLANAYIDAGSSVLDAVSIAARTSEIITGDEREEAQQYAQTLGVDLPTAARAMAGDVNALAVVNKLATDAMEENRDIADGMRESLQALTPEQQEQIVKNQGIIGSARELNGVVADATQKFNDQQGVLRGLIRDAGTATKEVDALGNELYTLPDGEQIMIDAETGQATTDVSRFKGDLDGIPETVNTRVAVDADVSRARETISNLNGQRIYVTVDASTGRTGVPFY